MAEHIQANCTEATTKWLLKPLPTVLDSFLASSKSYPTLQSKLTHQTTTNDCINTVDDPLIGNCNSKLAVTVQSMSLNMLQSASSGVHSWYSTRQDEQALPTQVAAPTTATPDTRSNASEKQAAPAVNSIQKPHIIPNNGASTKLYKSPAIDHQLTGTPPAKTKMRNKSEEAINDLLQRIPDIGRIFDVHSRIGNGTFSTVLLATLKRESHLPENSRRKFAIKHHIPTSHPDRIMKELQCMTKMGGTDNVVGIHCCLRCDASAAFVMPYMAHDRFHDFYIKMEVPEIRLYMRNLLMALAHVHKFNIIHRDVKPSNFLYNRRRREFLLVDFGLAQHVNVSTTAQLAQEARRVAGGGNKRSREYEIAEAATPINAAQPAEAAEEAALAGAAKRLRLHEVSTGASVAGGFNKMPLKPVNEIAQSTKSLETLALDDPKQSVNDADGMQAIEQQPQQEQNATAALPNNNNANNKYNTNRSSASVNNAKCFCFANPAVCITCLMKKEVHASRAGTPGYRPPEVLLKYADQTTSVDIWAAGVIFLSILSSIYPFFKAPNDYIALAEIVTIFGDRAIRKTALALERMVTLNQRSRPLNLRKLCLRFRFRNIFSDAQMIKKHESPDGRCDICKNCDQYYFNCLCEESEYVQEPLDRFECFPPSAYDLLQRLLEVNPLKRISAEEALKHPFFSGQDEEMVVPTRMFTAPKQIMRKRNPK